MVGHIVLMKCRSDVSTDQMTCLFLSLADLVNKVPGLLFYDGGKNNSPEGIAYGYTHAFYMQFMDSQARDSYLTHPEHEAVKKMIAGVLDNEEASVLVMDFGA